MANRSRGGDVVNFLFLCAVGVFMALPLVYVIVNAFKPLDEIFMFPPRFFVRNPTMNNFSELYIVLADSWVPFSRYIGNTIFITAATTFFHIAFSCMAAYALAKHTFFGSKALFNIVVLALMFNSTVTAVPNYLMVAQLGWIDTMLAVIVPAVQLPLGLYLMKQFMDPIPDSLLEAAEIDGAGEVRIFAQIMLPLCKPAMASVAIFTFINTWSDFMGPMLYLNRQESYTLSIGLQAFLQQHYVQWGILMAASAIFTIPMIVLFFFAQKYFIEGITVTGVKG